MRIERSFARSLALGGFAVLALAGCAGQSMDAVDPAPPTPPGRQGMEADAFEALFEARADSARMQFTEADVHFIRMMIPHHLQALEMSALASERTSNPEILALAARITGGQREEIQRMTEWLTARGLSVDAERDGGVAATDDHAHHTPDASGGMLMPGLLTPQEMAELAAARDTDFDRLYLRYMIYHHRGAMSMVDELFATDGAAREIDLFRLASEIHVDQGTEVARMERMRLLLPTLSGVP